MTVPEGVASVGLAEPQADPDDPPEPERSSNAWTPVTGEVRRPASACKKNASAKEIKDVDNDLSNNKYNEQNVAWSNNLLINRF